MIGTLAISAVIATVAVFAVDRVRRKARREQYIRSFMFPRGVFDKLLAARPSLSPKELQLVARGMRQFFLTFLKGGGQRIAMPSQVVDDLWHEFILFTREYQAFCASAFGQFLHHTPAVTMGKVKADNEGLRRVWWFSCLEENINPRRATRLPLLFAIDHKLGIANGFVYDLDCRRKPVEAGAGASVAAAQCTTDFSDQSIDGTLNGLGESGEDPRTGSSCGGGGSSCGASGTHGGGAEGGGADGGGGGCSGGCSGGCGGGS